MSKINVGELLWKGALEGVRLHDEQDLNRVGYLRGGNAGLFIEGEDGEVECVNSCPRQAYLRAKGYQIEEADDDRVRTERMFAAGRRNEDSFVERIERSYDGVILREEELGLEYKLSCDVMVSGRPDIVLADKKGEELLKGIENKRISSLWTGVKVLYKCEPKLSHLIQSGHYFDKLGVPSYDLWYTGDTDFALPGHFQYLPRKGKPLSEFLKFREGRRDAHATRCIEVGFELDWNEEDVLIFRQVSDKGEILSEWKESIVSKERIDKFYEFLGGCLLEAEKHDYLMPRPVLRTWNGKKEGYTQCDYCELKETCDEADGKSSLKHFLKGVLEAGYVLRQVKEK